jgi:hypothetical protein
MVAATTANSATQRMVAKTVVLPRASVEAS